MAYKYFQLTAFACLLLVCLNAVSALECYECDDLDPDKPDCNENDQKLVICGASQTHYDACLKVVTGQQQPNNSPDDRLRDNDVKEYTMKSCATLDTLIPHMAPRLKTCGVDFIAGGGWQNRCVCAGNKCNSADRPAAALLTLLAISGLLVLFQ